jgi:glycine cleavage system transcriptional repressor
MRSNRVVTLTGTDRVGIVEEVTRALADLGANVETSRMTRLGGEFAMLMLVSVEPEQDAALDAAIAALADRGFRVTSVPTGKSYAETHPGWLAYRIDVDGADHEGIVHEIAAGLSKQGISIESMETSVVPAPVSGSPLFRMSAVVVVPPGLNETSWIASLDEAARLSNVDVRVCAA